MGYPDEQSLVGALIEAYYEKRDVDAALACVTEDIHWVGTEKEERASNKEELRVLLKADVEAFSDSFQVELESMDEQKITNSVTQIWVTARQVEIPGIVCGFFIRGVLTCVKKDNEWLVSGVHVSVPNSEPEKYSLQLELDETRRKEQLLMNSIPGGTAIYRIKRSGEVVVDYLSEGLAKLCGFDNAADCFAMLKDGPQNGIPEEDWKRIYPSICQCVAEGKPIRETYCLYSKTKERITFTMNANVLTGGDLAGDDLAVLFAVHTLVTDEVRQLELERYRYRMILGMMNLAYWEWNGGNDTYSSPKHKEYAISDALVSDIVSPSSFMQYFHPDDIQIAKNIIKIGQTGENRNHGTLRAKMKDGTYRWTEILTLMDVSDSGIPRRIINVLRDVDEEWIRQKERLEIDELTGVFNRRYMEDTLSRYVEEVAEGAGNVVLAAVDVDDFKNLNDSYGHLAGDEALKEIASTLAHYFAISKDDYVARFGGDEFIIVCRNMEKSVFIERLRESIQGISKLSFEAYPEMKVEISIGCATTDELNNVSVRELIKIADERLYQVKESGKGTVE